MRKFNCWNISIVQQFSRFKESRIRSAVFGNSRQFFLMRQNDRADVDDVAKYFRTQPVGEPVEGQPVPVAAAVTSLCQACAWGPLSRHSPIP